MNNYREMRPWFLLMGAAVGVALIMLVGASVALASAPTTGARAAYAFKLCERATDRWERISDVPDKLLRAISMAESGRWSDTHKRVRAWPWTVTSGGPGTYYATKREALTEVRRLQAQGIKNIDVGCMQVNLGYHGQHFRSIEDAMDPDINAAYAAKFLTRLRDNAENWNQAAGHYHSMTPKRTAYYRTKVEKFWSQLTGEHDPGSRNQTAYATPNSSEQVRIAPIDRARTAALNARFKTLKTAARAMREELDPNAKRKRQMEAWRNARGRTAALQQLLAKRKAELEKRRQNELKAAFGSTREERFKANRLKQLSEWRKRNASSSESTN